MHSQLYGLNNRENLGDFINGITAARSPATNGRLDSSLTRGMYREHNLELYHVVDDVLLVRGTGKHDGPLAPDPCHNQRVQPAGVSGDAAPSSSLRGEEPFLGRGGSGGLATAYSDFDRAFPGLLSFERFREKIAAISFELSFEDWLLKNGFSSRSVTFDARRSLMGRYVYDSVLGATGVSELAMAFVDPSARKGVTAHPPVDRSRCPTMHLDVMIREARKDASADTSLASEAMASSDEGAIFKLLGYLTASAPFVREQVLTHMAARIAEIVHVPPAFTVKERRAFGMACYHCGFAPVYQGQIVSFRPLLSGGSKGLLQRRQNLAVVNGLMKQAKAPLAGGPIIIERSQTQGPNRDLAQTLADTPLSRRPDGEDVEAISAVLNYVDDPITKSMWGAETRERMIVAALQSRNLLATPEHALDEEANADSAHELLKEDPLRKGWVEKALAVLALVSPASAVALALRKKIDMVENRERQLEATANRDQRTSHIQVLDDADGEYLIGLAEGGTKAELSEEERTMLIEGASGWKKNGQWYAYGNYVGPGWSYGLRWSQNSALPPFDVLSSYLPSSMLPVDDVDVAAAYHDTDYANITLGVTGMDEKRADQKMLDALAAAEPSLKTKVARIVVGAAWKAKELGGLSFVTPGLGSNRKLVIVDEEGNEREMSFRYSPDDEASFRRLFDNISAEMSERTGKAYGWRNSGSMSRGTPIRIAPKLAGGSSFAAGGTTYHANFVEPATLARFAETSPSSTFNEFADSRTMSFDHEPTDMLSSIQYASDVDGAKGKILLGSGANTRVPFAAARNTRRAFAIRTGRGSWDRRRAFPADLLASSSEGLSNTRNIRLPTTAIDGIPSSEIFNITGTVQADVLGELHVELGRFAWHLGMATSLLPHVSDFGFDQPDFTNRFRVREAAPLTNAAVADHPTTRFSVCFCDASYVPTVLRRRDAIVIHVEQQNTVNQFYDAVIGAALSFAPWPAFAWTPRDGAGARLNERFVPMTFGETDFVVDTVFVAVDGPNQVHAIALIAAYNALYRVGQAAAGGVNAAAGGIGVDPAVYNNVDTGQALDIVPFRPFGGMRLWQLMELAIGAANQFSPSYLDLWKWICAGQQWWQYTLHNSSVGPNCLAEEPFRVAALTRAFLDVNRQVADTGRALANNELQFTQANRVRDLAAGANDVYFLPVGIAEKSRFDENYIQNLPWLPAETAGNITSLTLSAWYNVDSKAVNRDVTPLLRLDRVGPFQISGLFSDIWVDALLVLEGCLSVFNHSQSLVGQRRLDLASLLSLSFSRSGIDHFPTLSGGVLFTGAMPSLITTSPWIPPFREHMPASLTLPSRELFAVIQPLLKQRTRTTVAGNMRSTFEVPEMFRSTVLIMMLRLMSSSEQFNPAVQIMDYDGVVVATTQATQIENSAMGMRPRITRWPSRAAGGGQALRYNEAYVPVYANARLWNEVLPDRFTTENAICLVRESPAFAVSYDSGLLPGYALDKHSASVVDALLGSLMRTSSGEERASSGGEGEP